MKNQIMSHVAKASGLGSILTVAVIAASVLSSSAEAASQRVSAFGCHVQMLSNTLHGVADREGHIRYNIFHGVSSSDLSYSLSFSCAIPDSTDYPKTTVDYINFHGYKEAGGSGGGDIAYMAMEGNYNSYGADVVYAYGDGYGYHTEVMQDPWTTTSRYGHIMVWLPVYTESGTAPAFKGAYLVY